MCRSKVFLILPPPPAMPSTRCFTHSGVSIGICTSSIRRGWGQVSRTLLCWSGLGRPSYGWLVGTLAACPHPMSSNGPVLTVVGENFPPTAGWSVTHDMRMQEDMDALGGQPLLLQVVEQTPLMGVAPLSQFSGPLRHLIIPGWRSLACPPQACILLGHLVSTSHLTLHFYWAP